jgi:glutaminyl-tRNA synthetase
MSDAPKTHFLRQIIDADLAAGRHHEVVTRFPPEPNGYLHIGHAKSIGLNFGTAEAYEGQVPARCHLRFDDTNPETEDEEYVESIKRDVAWLGHSWGDHLYFASDYFERFYEMAEGLINDGFAYVDSQTEEEIRENRGTVTEPGTPSPYRDRSPEENLDLFRRMQAGEFADGAHVLRAKGDMASPNMKMRDPLLYRIRRGQHHYRTGSRWNVYPMYDFAHGLEDAIEGVTHSFCTLEFDNNRAIYDWVVEHVRPTPDAEPGAWEPRPHQHEFARGNLDYTVVSKRKLLKLVKEKHVAGWDDPRMPTLAGLRRRGVRPEAIRAFWDAMGIAKADNSIEIVQLEQAIRDDLNHEAPRVMAVLRPLKLTLTNWPEGETEMLTGDLWPHDIPKEATREIPFSGTLWIDREDFQENPNRKWHRLAPGAEVRLRQAYIVRCTDVVKDENGEVTELKAEVDLDSKSGTEGAKRRVKGTVHWVSAAHAVPAEVRLYDRLFKVPNPDQVEEGQTFLDHLNPDSLEVVHAQVEPFLKDAEPGDRFQFERTGYFAVDPDSTPDKLVFNRTVTLKDTWAKQSEPEPAPASKPKPKAPAAPAGPRDPAAGLSADARATYDRYIDNGIGQEEAAVIAASPAAVRFFEAAAAHHEAPAVANWTVHELLGRAADPAETPLTPDAFAGLVKLVDDGDLNQRMARQVLDELLDNGGRPADVVERLGLAVVSGDDQLGPIADGVIAQFPDKVEAYRGGKRGLIGFFVGQAMQATGGAADPKRVRELMEERLG